MACQDRKRAARPAERASRWRTSRGQCHATCAAPRGQCHGIRGRCQRAAGATHQGEDGWVTARTDDNRPTAGAPAPRRKFIGGGNQRTEGNKRTVARSHSPRGPTVWHLQLSGLMQPSPGPPPIDLRAASCQEAAVLSFLQLTATCAGGAARALRPHRNHACGLCTELCHAVSGWWRVCVCVCVQLSCRSSAQFTPSDSYANLLFATTTAVPSSTGRQEKLKTRG